MGDLPYISSKPGGLIIHTELIYEYTCYKLLYLYLYNNFELKTGGLIIHHGLIIRTVRYTKYFYTQSSNTVKYIPGDDGTSCAGLLVPFGRLL